MSRSSLERKSRVRCRLFTGNPHGQRRLAIGRLVLAPLEQLPLYAVAQLAYGQRRDPIQQILLGVTQCAGYQLLHVDGARIRHRFALQHIDNDAQRLLGLELLEGQHLDQLLEHVQHNVLGAIDHLADAARAQRILGMLEYTGNQLLGVHIGALVIEDGDHLVEELAQILGPYVYEILFGHNALQMLRDALGYAIRVSALEAVRCLAQIQR